VGDGMLTRGVVGIRMSDGRGVLRSLGLVVRMLDLWLKSLLQRFKPSSIVGYRFSNPQLRDIR
jgi:hypothetical protein